MKSVSNVTVMLLAFGVKVPESKTSTACGGSFVSEVVLSYLKGIRPTKVSDLIWFPCFVAIDNVVLAVLYQVIKYQSRNGYGPKDDLKCGQVLFNISTSLSTSLGSRPL